MPEQGAIPEYVILAPHWSELDGEPRAKAARPHIATPGEHWPVPSDIAVCGASIAGPDRQRAGRSDEACYVCYATLVVHPERAFVAQGPKPQVNRPDHPDAYCAHCNHHADGHIYTEANRVGTPCFECPDGLCRQGSGARS